MKRIVVILMLMCLCLTQGVKAIEWEARTGISFSNTWGLHTAALIGFPVTERFQIKPGVILHTVQKDIYNASSGDFRIGINIPVYAAFRIPMGNICKLRLEAGPYVGLEPHTGHVGASIGVGVERAHWSWGISYFQNCITNKAYQAHLSVGYNFSCK